MDFSTVKEFTIPEGKVKQISVNGSVIWKAKTLKPVMADNEWVDIFNAFKNGDAPNTWLVGDTKPMTLTDGTTYTIRLCDKQANRYSYSSGVGGSKAVFEFVELVKVDTSTRFKMNNASINAGGWANCYLRLVYLQWIEALVPTNILSAISEVNVLSGMGGGTSSGTSSSANKLFLPAEMEMFSLKTYSIGLEECPLGQFDYYKAHDTKEDRVKRNVGTTTQFFYWTRSPKSRSTNIFCIVSNSGTDEQGDASTAFGVAPIFAI